MSILTEQDQSAQVYSAELDDRYSNGLVDFLAQAAGTGNDETIRANQSPRSSTGDLATATQLPEKPPSKKSRAPKTEVALPESKFLYQLTTLSPIAVIGERVQFELAHIEGRAKVKTLSIKLVGTAANGIEMVRKPKFKYTMADADEKLIDSLPTGDVWSVFADRSLVTIQFLGKRGRVVAQTSVTYSNWENCAALHQFLPDQATWRQLGLIQPWMGSLHNLPTLNSSQSEMKRLKPDLRVVATKWISPTQMLLILKNHGLAQKEKTLWKIFPQSGISQISGFSQRGEIGPLIKTGTTFIAIDHFSQLPLLAKRGGTISLWLADQGLIQIEIPPYSPINPNELINSDKGNSAATQILEPVRSTDLP